MHKPEKFGDNLTEIRQDFKKVNRVHSVVRGFSEGRTAHAIRNVYPIYDTDKSYLASIEISFPTELFQKKLNEMSQIHTHFLVKKSIFKSKAWSRNDRILSYEPSLEHKDYMMAFVELHDRSEMFFHQKHLELHRDEINSFIAKEKKFSIYSNVDDDIKIISFLPITQNVTHKVVAWLVSYQEDSFVKAAIKDTLKARIIGSIIIVIFLLFIYFIFRQKEKMRKLLSSYDKNVIFSTTDLHGKITHVSSAFCEISGYREEELIGKSHNVVRHKDMPKAFFSNMWNTIKVGKEWIGEVKNVRKDGSAYWVKAEIEPEFDSHGKVTGYIATRHDITGAKEIEEIQKEIIFTMGAIGEIRSKETANHVKRVAEYSKILALHAGLNENEAEMLRMASPMHDIGKVGIPDSILHKPGKLSDEEWEVMKTHVNKGYEMLKHSERPLMKMAAIVALEHHEKYDGTGYPLGLYGEDIHIYGRITALADVYDALSSNRVYKKAWEEQRVLEFIKEQKGKHFDPELVKIFFEHYSEIEAVKKRYEDR